ncbi:hypothetical protein [Tabrizicola flagellatus]|uniref:hypothetical protein n=1 Tax=Tabrizicola flagellatus TaxID=2593021 RepID=UPI0011F290E8|nr:hypothetical protein [Tabrizicola flagellatus]
MFASTLPSFGYADIALKMSVSEDHARKIVRAWRRDGLLEEVRSGHRIRSLWRVRPEARSLTASASRSPEQNMWTAMRQFGGGFTPRDLAVHATTAATEVTVQMAQDYCRALLGAGYLAVTRKAVPGKMPAIYRLTKNTGPRAPRERRVRAVVDDNIEQTILIGGSA